MEKQSRHIRKANTHDIEKIRVVFDAAKTIMRTSGNTTQWKDGYPSASIIATDIEKEGGYIIEENYSVIGYFAFLPSPEPTYNTIHSGKWLDSEKPYYVIHRIASLPSVHGIFHDILDFCFSHTDNIRIDTHRDNLIMQHNITKHSFSYCGIIYLASGDERLAYQKII